MKMRWTPVVVALMLGLSASGWAQGSPGGLPPPHPKSGPIEWYGKAPPGWGGVVTHMKLLAPGVGWAEREQRLYWTTDNGANWTDITPPITGIADIFFLDTHRGWATIKRDGPPSSDEIQIDLASTADAGATWSATHVTLPLKDYRLSSDDLSDYKGGPIAFVDPLHGWMGVELGGLSMNSWWNFLLVTSDGGRTWRPAPEPPILKRADALLVTPNDGWMTGDQDFFRDKLYVTRDGAKSWKEVSLTAPKEILPADQPAYDLPVFGDSKHGFVAVTYSGGERVKSAAVLFATVDGGRSWNADRILKNLEPDIGGQTLQSAVIGSTWVTAVAPKRQLMLSTLGPGAKINVNPSAGADRWSRFQPRQLSFVSPTQGWVIGGDGDFLSTADEGATWTKLLPGPQPHVIHPQGRFTPRQWMENSAAPAPQLNPSPAEAPAVNTPDSVALRASRSV